VSATFEPTRQTLRAYLREHDLATDGLTRDALREIGMIFRVRVRLQGAVGDPMRLRWQLYRANGRRVRRPAYNQFLGAYTPETQDHAKGATFWAPFPARPGRYYARFTLVDGTDEAVDDFVMRPFPIRDIP
jgi:hypothetical protein